MPGTKYHSVKEGGYGWVVTAIGFFTGLIELGTFKSFGVLILPIRDSLDCPISALGTAMAASHTACYVIVPLVNFMTEKYGARRLVVVGGAIMFISFLGIYFAKGIAQFLAFVILWGIGVSFAYNPPIVTMLMFFPTNAALPYSIIQTGCAFGMMIYPPVTEALIQTYGWRATILLLAAINANVCVLGALINPPSSAYSVLVSDHTASEKMTNSHRKQCTLFSSCTAAASEVFNYLSFDVLWKQPKSAVYSLACFMVGIMYSAWMIYLVPHAVARDIDSLRASFLSTAGGVGTLLGRILYGPILHREYIKPVTMFILLAALNFGAFVLDPVVSDNYPGLVVLASVAGLTLGTLSSLFILICQQVLENDSKIRAWGTMCVFFAVGELAGGAFAGLVYDAFGSYEVSFLLLGGLSAVIVTVVVVERLLNHCTT